MDQAELQKLEIEKEKLSLEREKTRISRNSYRLDYVSKVGIPLAVFVLAGATYWTNKDYSERHFEFEKDVKALELQQKNDEIIRQKDQVSRESERDKSAFLQNHFGAITTDSQNELEMLKASVASTFVNEKDQVDVLARIDQLRHTADAYAVRVKGNVPASSVPGTPSPTQPQSENHGDATQGTQAAANYMTYGRALLSKGNFDQAAANFEMASLLTPSDPSAWNSLSYAQLRSGRADAAYKSIATALSLRPADSQTQNFAAINATKILCALGQTNEGQKYLEAALGALPSLYQMASTDPEITRYCGFSVQTANSMTRNLPKEGSPG